MGMIYHKISYNVLFIYELIYILL